MDEGANVGEPCVQCFVGAVQAWRARKIPARGAAAARLVTEFPCEDCRRVFVARYHCLDVILICGDDFRNVVEIIMVLAAEIDGVDVHSAVWVKLVFDFDG